MTIDKPTYQLKLPLELPEEQADDSMLSVDEIRLREEAARQQFEGGQYWQVDAEGEKQVPEWFETYLKLTGGGWPFRVALLIVWLAQPKPRVPKTQNELAKMMGLNSDRQFSIWRAKNPAIDAQVEQVRFAMVFDAMSDIFAASIAVATTHDYKGRGDREMLYKMRGYLSDKIEADITTRGADLSKLSFAEILELANIKNPEEILAMRKRLQADKPEFEEEEEPEDGDAGSNAG